MYIVNAKDLRGVDKEEVRSRLAIVEYLTEWSGGVYQEAKSKKTVSLAGRYIRSRIVEKGDTLARMLEEVVVIDLIDFWRAVDGYNGRRDDVNLYGIFCMLFSEVNADMKAESKKLEGNIGFAPRLRYDISERTASAVVANTKGKKGLLKGKKKGKSNKPKEEVSKEGLTTRERIELGENVNEEGLLDATEEEEDYPEETIVEIKDKYVTPDNVNKLTIIAVGVIGVLVVTMTCLILF